MNDSINIPQTQIVLAFVATCIESAARTLGVSYREVFMRMKRLGMIENYIYPNYGVLHTESHDRSTGLYLYGDLYVADEYMRETNLYNS